LSAVKINPQNNVEFNIGRQIISQKEIELSGVSRLSDIYSLLNEWNATTIDGYRWQIFSSKTNFDQSQNWILMLDGQRMDLNFFDMKNINFLPLSSWDIDSVEAISSAQLYNGEFSDGGLLNVSTRKPVKGFTFHAQFYTGNESGDPGPYKYVDKYYSENIDIIGPDYAFGLEYGGDFINASINYKTNAYIYPTSDKPVSFRLTDYEFKYRKVFMDAVSMLMDFPNLLSRPKIIAAYSGTGKYDLVSKYGSDLIFYDPLFNETPVDNKFKHLGLTGSFCLGKTSSLDYNAKWSSTKVKDSQKFSQYLIDWRMDNYYFSTQYNSAGNNFDYHIGASVDHYIATTPYELKDNTIDLYKIIGSLNSEINSRTRQYADFMIVNNGKHSAFKSSLKNLISISERNSIENKIYFSETLFDEKNDILYWSAQGYKTPENTNWIASSITSNKSTNIGIETAWIYNPEQNISFRFNIFFNRFFSMIYEDEQLTYNADEKTISGSSQLISGIDGNTFGLSLDAKQKLSNNLSHELFYEYCGEGGSGQLYKDLWDIFPEHKLRYNASYLGENDFGIRGEVTFMSASKWRNFYSIENKSGGIYKSKQKARILCDLSVQKLFWEKRLRINAAFKNLLNQKNRYSPIGAYFDFSFYLLAELAI
jgi:hypothetical protein